MIATGSLLVSLTIAAASVSAQSSSGGLISGLSQSCTTAATGLISGDIANCANVIGLVSVVSATGSVITPLNNWINSICTSDPCSSSTLSSASSQISQGCASDVQNGQVTATALSVIINQYPKVRETLCLQAASNNTYCVTNLLTDVQKANGTDITVESVQTLLSGGTQGLLGDLARLPPSAYCTDCFKAITINTAQITANISSTSSASSSLTSAVAGQCGASFADGQVPSTVRQAGSGSSASASAGAGSNSAASTVSFNGGLFGALTAAAGAIVAGAVAVAL
jgi:hypothetical protein